MNYTIQSLKKKYDTLDSNHYGCIQVGPWSNLAQRNYALSVRSWPRRRRPRSWSWSKCTYLPNVYVNKIKCTYIFFYRQMNGKHWARFHRNRAIFVDYSANLLRKRWLNSIYREHNFLESLWELGVGTMGQAEHTHSDLNQLRRLFFHFIALCFLFTGFYFR